MTATTKTNDDGRRKAAIIHGDCIKIMSRMPARSVDFVFADPPFNRGVNYGNGRQADRLSNHEYLHKSRNWIGQVVRLLKSDGTFWLAIGDRYAAELKVLATHELGLTCRNWIIWHYRFGVHCENKFGRDHTHLLYFVRNPKHFTFNADAIRVPSARQTKYNDKRANPNGRVPGDVWEFSRVCGTFEERVGWHPCQMPEKLLELVILATTNPGDLVLDPFAGSGTTLVVAVRHGRGAIGCEINETYVEGIRQRMPCVDSGDALVVPAQGGS